MHNKFLVPVIVFLSLFVFIIIILIILRSRKKSKYKKEIIDLDYEKNNLINAGLLTELSKVRELVKTDDLKNKLNDWDEVVREIKEEKIDVLTDLITEADFLVDRHDYKNALKKIASLEISIESLKNKTTNLLEEIRVITNSEERNRGIITKLKAIFRELESKYERNKKDYDILASSIDEYLVKIDKQFKKFETLMDKND